MKYVIITVLLMAAAYGCGTLHGTERVEYVKIRQPAPPQKTETVTETVTKYKTDPDCLAYKDKAQEIAAQAELLYGLGPEQLQIISQGRMALASGDVTALNDLENRQRKFDNKANEPLIELTNLLDQLENLKGCK